MILKRVSWMLASLALPLGLGILVGVGNSQPVPKKWKLAFVTNNPADFWTVAHKGVERAERELRIKVDFQIPAGGTASEQTRIVDNLLAKGVDGIAISPVDPANQTYLINETARKTLVFTQDSDAPKSNRTCYIGTDNIAAGRQAGEQLKRVLPRGGKIMVFVGKRDAQNPLERIQGLRDALKGSNLRIVDVRTDHTDRTRAKSNVSDSLVIHPDLAACVGIWSYNGPAILSALRDAKKTGKVKIVCFDEEQETLEGIKRGEISASVVQQPELFGYLSVINMNKYLSGDKTVVPPSKQVSVPTLVIQQNNVDAFKKNLDQLRGW